MSGSIQIFQGPTLVTAYGYMKYSIIAGCSGFKLELHLGSGNEGVIYMT